MEINKEQAIWLVEVFKANTYGRGFKGDVKANYEEAERLLRGWDKPNVRTCSCEYTALTRVTNSFYDQYEAQIMEKYNETEPTQHVSSTDTITKPRGKGRSIQKG